MNRNEPTDAFSYQEHEAYLHEQEQRRNQDERMSEGPTKEPERLPPLTGEDILRQNFIAELEGLLGPSGFVVVGDIEELITKLKEKEGGL